MRDSDPVLGAPKLIPPPIRTEEEALNWMEELLSDCETARANLNVIIPDDHDATVRWQTKAMCIFYMRQGSALGSLMSLFRCGKLSDTAYMTMRQRCMNTLAASVVG